jgi:hypothetical protein
MLTCLLFLGDYAAGKPLPASVEQAGGSARLIIKRIPNLGNRVFVDLYLDGQPIGTIGYGHTYHGLVPTGQHVLAVRATPRARSTTAQAITLNVRSGETYTFTAMGDNSGSLILRANK